ncbi:hypothetical protein CPLU01_10935 [Colletotrichum plurivorum]|uniref:Uncharacterized protein n=1 Tax=Colletotrichum plurivorum TaxID=2175906 RepID=A0A8H6K4W5_9PEZI|nr:hypothetical protein CPLU01_10935 [Colletotrichum plurivorum]
MYNASQDGRLDRLSVARCLDLYGDAFQSSRGNLLIVVEEPEERLSEDDIQFHKDAKAFPQGIPQPFEWICRRETINETHTCEDWLFDFKATPGNWTPFQSAVKECYSQRTDEHCKLKFSNLLCWVVAAVNLLKVALMLLVAFGRGESPLLTVGDAVASFLEHTDETTRASFTHWVMYHFLNLIPIVVSGFLLGRGLSMMTGNKDITNLGLGAVNTKTIMIPAPQGAGNLVVNALIVNTPQAIMSFIYLNYNSLYTNISLVTEWDRFSHHRKGLRVSSPPQGAQRNTYFLQLPYRYSLPIITFSAVIHWLISQSIFLVNLEIYGPPDNDLMNFIPAEYTYQPPDQEVSGASFTACGWSPSGIIAGTVANLCMIAFILASGGRRLRFGSAPVAGSCSAAISAACHPCEAEENAWEEPLQWGVVAAPTDGPGRCAFSSASVGVPSEGQLYA